MPRSRGCFNAARAFLQSSADNDKDSERRMSLAEDGLTSGSPSETGDRPDSWPKGSSVGCSSAAPSSVWCLVYRALENG
eukprot:1109866-Rhodomonas_salina.1